MQAWLADNIGTILISLILALIVGAILFFMIRRKTQGKASCSCGCDCTRCRSGCPHSQGFSSKEASPDGSPD